MALEWSWPCSAALPLRLTLLGLLLQPVGLGWVRSALLAMAVAGLVFGRLLHGPWLWLALAVCACTRVLLSWPLGDNHAYLLAYWLLALGLAGFTGDPRRAIAASGRWLIGLVFAFAVLWKAISPDFLDDRFFRYTLVMDPRLEWVTRLAGGQSEQELAAQRAFLGQHVDGALPVAREPTARPESSRLRGLARVATLSTFALELALALAFLWPPSGAPSRWRDALLLGFCAVTYAVAPVEGFGWLLLALGLAQCQSSPPWRVAYPAVFALLVAYRDLPWRDWLLA